MGEGWELEEGVLRGKRKEDGSWEFFQVVVFDEDKGPETFLLDASTAAEARRVASRAEKRELERYAEMRRHHHAINSFNEGGWVGEILDKPPAKFLIDEFELDVEQLSTMQLGYLERDVLAIDHSFLTRAKQRAKSELQTTRKALAQLAKQKDRLEGLSRGFRAMAHFSPLAAPEETLAQLLFELSENEKAIGENLDELGHDKSNVTAVSLCANAIDIFLRWGDKEMPDEVRGIKYSAKCDELAVLSKIVGDPSEKVPPKFTGPLGEYLEEIQIVLSKEGLEGWAFGVHEPARKALSTFAKRQEFMA